MVTNRSAEALMSQKQACRYGTIECRVYRGEKLSGRVYGVDSKAVAPPPSELCRGFLKGRHITHVSRVGTRVEVETTTKRRHVARSVDPKEAPFAWFKFHYRSREYLGVEIQAWKIRAAFDVAQGSCPELQRQTRSFISSLETTIHERGKLAAAEHAVFGDHQLLATKLREGIRKARENADRLRANGRWNIGTLQVAAQEDSWDDDDRSSSGEGGVPQVSCKEKKMSETRFSNRS
ncbi:hypothetical protein HOY80DRAFT_1030296 [Tuber brumale]|nr:hypothetical protein HOY80DRAFT_1030296 [Tuber brumale]